MGCVLFYVLWLDKLICTDARCPAVPSDDADAHISVMTWLFAAQSRGLLPKRQQKLGLLSTVPCGLVTFCKVIF